MGNRYYKDKIFGYLAGDLRDHVVFYNNIDDYYKYIDHKREVIRNFITWIEATINYMTEYLINIGKQNPSLFNLNTMQQLEANWSDFNLKSAPKSLRFIDKIRITIQLFLNNQSQSNLLFPKRMDFKGKFKYTFNLFATHHDLLPIYKEYIGKHFKNLIKAVVIRNKFTHPRKEEDLYISKSEFDMAWQSYKDYYDFQITLFDGIIYENRNG